MEKPPSRKEVGKILSELASPKAYEEGRLSAFKEMMDWAKKKGDFYDAERQQHLIGSPDEVIAHAKLRQYEIMEEFAEAKMKVK
jgi:hypothetical protein